MEETMDGKIPNNRRNSWHCRYLPCPEFDFWLHAIVTDNRQEVERKLHSVTEEERDLLLHGRFQLHGSCNADHEALSDCNSPEGRHIHATPTISAAKRLAHSGGSSFSSDDINNELKNRFRLVWGNKNITRPLCMAAVCNAHHVIDVFLKFGIQVTQRDQGGYNLVHSLVYFSYLNAPLELEMKETYMYLKYALSLRDRSILKTLLYAEDNQRLRPIELAAHLGTPLMFLALLETDNIYMIRQDSLGMYSLQWFDITPYEALVLTNRRHVSPLKCFAKLEECKLKNGAMRQLFTSDFIQSWSKAKFTVNKSFVAIWCSLRVTFILLYLLGSGLVYKESTSGENSTDSLSENFVNGTENVSSPGFDWTLTIVLRSLLLISLFVYSITVIAYDINDYFIMHNFTSWLEATPRGEKKLLLSNSSYRTAQFVFASCLFLTTGTSLWSIFTHQNIVLEFQSGVHAVAVVSSIWSMGLFFQLMPWFSLLLAALQRSSQDMGKILAVYASFIVMYMSAVYCFIHPKYQNVFKTGSFSDKLLILLDVTEIFVNAKLAKSVHSAIIVVATFILISVLAALFLCSYLEISSHKTIVHTIQRLSIVCPLEQIMQIFFPNYIKHEQEKSFVCISDKMYTPRLVLKRRIKRSLSSSAVTRNFNFNPGAQRRENFRKSQSMDN